jgi:hypothetical protein
VEVSVRLDGVEIKVSFSRHQTPTAVKELELPSPPRPWQIYFCEDVNPGAPATPLLDLNVIVRARVRPGEDDDVTIKLRPCRSSQFTDHWLKDTGRQLKVEADWAGDRHVLAASHTEDQHESVIRAVVAKRRPFTDLFTRRQLEFLTDCAGTTINLDTLTLLPPVTAVRWGKRVTVGPAHLGLRAERWTVDELDFLELSAVVEAVEGASKAVEKASARQADILEFVSSLGLSVPGEQEPKTRQVLDHLVRASLRTMQRSPSGLRGRGR